METRLEKNKRRRKERWIRRFKSFLILIIIVLLIIGIEMVNETIVKLDCIDNPNIVRFNLNSNKIDIFGESYIFDFKEIKKILKGRLSGLF